MKNSLFNMMCLDIYASSLGKVRYDHLLSKMKIETKVMPLMSWDIFAKSPYHGFVYSKIDTDVSKVKALASKFNWDNDLDVIFEGEIFDAIIITDVSQNILWVNEGFTNMTGYSKDEALDKTPRFLQGSKTLPTIKKRIRKKLISGTPFKEVIINHKKDGTSYTCEVKIFPLYADGSKTHFMALEREVG